MLIRCHEMLEQIPAKTPPPRIDRDAAAQLIELCLDELPPYLRRVLNAARFLVLDLGNERHCGLIALHLGIKIGTLRTYKAKIRIHCRPLREMFVALFSEIPND